MNSRFGLNNVMVFAVFGILAFLICGFTAYLVINTTQSERKIPFAGDIPGTTVETLVELDNDRAYPESIMIGNDGNIYSGSYCTGEIWKISPDGELEIFLAADSGINAVGGMAFDESGVLYVVDRGDCNPTRGGSALKRVMPDGTVEDWGAVTDDEVLNDLTFDGDGLLYATDSQLAQVRTFNADGEARVWWEVPNNPNNPVPTGITYDPNRDSILVSDSNNGIVYTVPIEDDGSPGDFGVLYDNSLHSLDGLTLDDQGRVIVTIYDTSEVVRLEDDGFVTILAKNFREPSDVAYLDGQIFVTNFDSISLAPILSIALNPSLPFTIDVITLPDA